VITTTTGAVDELIRQVAGEGATPVLRLLGACQLCRNHLLYLLDTIPVTGDAGRITARLRALPEVHRTHYQPGHPDSAPPQVRWLLT
jgi:hypothetical protein